jgi:ABC-type multidrug transport system ATPase subunit
VILSTHIVEDVRELCSTMAIINRGRVVLTGDPNSVLEEARGRIWRRRVSREELSNYEAEMSVISVRLQAGEPVIQVWSDASPGEGFESVAPVLEDVYFHRVGAAGAEA